MSVAQLKFGVDLVTFFHPGFWGVSDGDGIVALAAEDPKAFWVKALDAVEASGIKGIELTFPPFDWRGAVAAFGSEAGFAEALAKRGLTICSGFFADLANFAPGDDVDALIAKAEDYAAFLGTYEAGIMVAGLPMRQTPGLPETAPYDFDAAKELADVIHKLAKALEAKGTRLALHTEAHSVFCAARDVDLMMMLTDPTLVHFCPDTAHLILMGGDPLAIVDRHHERMIIAHWKDAIGAMPADTPIGEDIHDLHRPYFCGFGQGRVDWHGWVRLLQKRKASGWVILELDAAPDPVGDLQRGLAFVAGSLLPDTK
jgi:sugar phosphate isomerase/epimerase